MGADLIVALHFAFVVFVVLGGLLALRWPRVIWLHMPAVIWGALVEFTGWICPLTPLENRLRRASGETGYRGRLHRPIHSAGALPERPDAQRSTRARRRGARHQRRHLRVRLRPPSPLGPAKRHMIVHPMNWDLQGWPASARTAVLSLARHRRRVSDRAGRAATSSRTSSARSRGGRATVDRSARGGGGAPGAVLERARRHLHRRRLLASRARICDRARQGRCMSSPPRR